MSFELLFALSVLLVVSIGHVGLWIALYNRINATGLNRKTIKRIELAIVFTCGFIPIVIVLHEIGHQGLSSVVQGIAECSTNWSWITVGYGTLAAATGIALLPFWIRDRPAFAIANDRFQVTSSEDLYPLKQSKARREILQGIKFRTMAKLPGNQIAALQRNVKRLTFQSLPIDLIGLKIAHLSDVHLTGQLSNVFYRLAVDWIIEQSPDMVVISGDIVDYEHALEQLKPSLEGLIAPLGMYFVLGNHDRRLADPMVVCRTLCKLGWIDLGQHDAIVQRGMTSIRILGNERPWFNRNVAHESLNESSSSTLNDWTLGVSHSPDQFEWGVRHGCHLMLCGHTHGGQIRFPLIGPVVAPSWHGTRYASGVFMKQNTIMHVSRGLSGVHPFRWGCLPEVSVIELGHN